MPITDDAPHRGDAAWTKLEEWVARWEELRANIEKVNDSLRDPPPGAELDALREQLQDLQTQRRHAVVVVTDLVARRPKLKDDAIALGFRADLLPDVEAPDRSGDEVGGDAVDEVATTDKGYDAPGGKKDDPGSPNTRRQARDNRLLGKQGQDYDIVRGPRGSYMARYTFRIGGEVIQVGVRIHRDELDKYGVKKNAVKQLTKAQFGRIEDIGWADELAPEIRSGDGHVMKSLVRYLRNQYGGQGILENDEVMSVVIANSLQGWSTGEFENQLRNTKWYQNTNEYQRQWQTVTSTKEKRQTIDRTTQLVINTLEDAYGLDWVKYVDGGMRQAKEWGRNIASGKFGTPDEGLGVWGERQMDKAATIEGTPAWVLRQSEQEQLNASLNRPEDMFERLRSEAMGYLGQTNGKPLVDRNTLQGWATDLVSGTRSDGDWQQFLRQQMRSLHPYFDENVAFTDQASSYKSVAESILGTTLTWDDPLLMKIAGTDDSGKPTGSAMSIYDYGQWIRDNDQRFWDNPQTEERGRSLAAGVLNKMLGVSA